MSPEQARGHVNKVGPLADVWAVGLIAFRLLTGKNYWSADGMAALIGQICYEPLQAPSQLAPHVGPRFDAWFARACAREQEHRFPSAGKAVEELAIALGVQGGQHSVPEISYFPVGHPAATPSGPIAISHAPMNMTPMTPMPASPLHVTPFPGATTSSPPVNPYGPSAPTPPRPMMPSAPSMSQPGFALAPPPYSSPSKKQLSTGAALAVGLGIAVLIAGGAGSAWLAFGRPGMRAEPATNAATEPAAAAAPATAPATEPATATATATATAAEPEPSAEAVAEAPSAEPSAEPSASAQASAAPAAPSSAPSSAPQAATAGEHRPAPKAGGSASPNAPKVGKINF
jgi:serine/threonine-protein kinase